MEIAEVVRRVVVGTATPQRLERLRAMQQSGEWPHIARPFGFGPDNVPGPDVTTECLCSS